MHSPLVAIGSEEQVESGLDRNKENLACLRTKGSGGGAKTRITFKGTLLRKKNHCHYYTNIKGISNKVWLGQRRRNFGESAI